MSDPFATPTQDPFMESAGNPGLKFENPGDIHVIIVRSVTKKIDVAPDGTVRSWPNGDPMHVFVFTGESGGETADLWVRGNMITAIRDAVKKAGLDTVINTKVTVKFSELGVKKPGQNAPKLFLAKVEAVAPAAVIDDEDPF